MSLSDWFREQETLEIEAEMARRTIPQLMSLPLDHLVVALWHLEKMQERMGK